MKSNEEAHKRQGDQVSMINSKSLKNSILLQVEIFSRFGVKEMGNSVCKLEK